MEGLIDVVPTRVRFSSVQGHATRNVLIRNISKNTLPLEVIGPELPFSIASSAHPLDKVVTLAPDGVLPLQVRVDLDARHGSSNSHVSQGSAAVACDILTIGTELLRPMAVDILCVADDMQESQITELVQSARRRIGARASVKGREQGQAASGQQHSCSTELPLQPVQEKDELREEVVEHRQEEVMPERQQDRRTPLPEDLDTTLMPQLAATSSSPACINKEACDNKVVDALTQFLGEPPSAAAVRKPSGNEVKAMATSEMRVHHSQPARLGAAQRQAVRRSASRDSLDTSCSHERHRHQDDDRPPTPTPAAFAEDVGAFGSSSASGSLRKHVQSTSPTSASSLCGSDKRSNRVSKLRSSEASLSRSMPQVQQLPPRCPASGVTEKLPRLKAAASSSDALRDGHATYSLHQSSSSSSYTFYLDGLGWFDEFGQPAAPRTRSQEDPGICAAMPKAKRKQSHSCGPKIKLSAKDHDLNWAALGGI